MEWASLLRNPPWWLKTCLGFGLTMISFALLRSLYEIHQFGLRNYVRSAFRMDAQSLLLIGILLIVAVGTAATFVIHEGSPWSMSP